MNADGSGTRRLTHNTGYDGEPAWSPDGRKIAFQSRRRFGAESQGVGEIYVMNADGSGKRNLTRNPAQDGRPSWSPDGRRIAFVSNRDGRRLEAHVMNADGSGQRSLASRRDKGGRCASVPSISPRRYRWNDSALPRTWRSCRVEICSMVAPRVGPGTPALREGEGVPLLGLPPVPHQRGEAKKTMSSTSPFSSSVHSPLASPCTVVPSSRSYSYVPCGEGGSPNDLDLSTRSPSGGCCSLRVPCSPSCAWAAARLLHAGPSRSVSASQVNRTTTHVGRRSCPGPPGSPVAILMDLACASLVHRPYLSPLVRLAPAGPHRLRHRGRTPVGGEPLCSLS